jgi:biopolymer transport protein ExbB
MAENKPTAPVAKTATSVQPKKEGNAISWIAPVACIVAGYAIWRFLLGNPSNFERAYVEGGPTSFWPTHEGPLNALVRMYEGGIVVPLLIGLLLMVIVFAIERGLTMVKQPVKEALQNLCVRCNTTWLTKISVRPLQSATSKKEA